MPTRLFSHHLAAISLVAFTLFTAACASTPEYKEIGAETASTMIGKEADVVVLDIRTPEEYADGHIDGSVNIDFKAENFGEKIGQLDREKTYIVHCRSGRRSAESLETLSDQEPALTSRLYFNLSRILCQKIISLHRRFVV